MTYALFSEAPRTPEPSDLLTKKFFNNSPSLRADGNLIRHKWWCNFR